MKNKIIPAVILMLFIQHLASAQITYQKGFGDTTFYNSSFIPTNDGGGLLTLLEDSHEFAVLVKTDALGDTLWVKQYSSGIKHFSCKTIQTFDSGFLIVGESKNYSPNGSMFLAKTDASGNVLWSKRYDIGVAVTRVVQNADSGFTMVYAKDIFQLELRCFYVCRVNAAGNIIWTRKYDFGNVGDHFVPGGTINTSDGGYMVSFKYFPVPSGKHMAVKLDSMGMFSWSREYEYLDEYYYLSYVSEASDGGFLFNTSNWNQLVKTNANGNYMWAKKYTLNGEKIYLTGPPLLTKDHGFVMSSSKDDLYYFKLDSMGVPEWSKRMPDKNATSAHQAMDGGFVFHGFIGYGQASTFLLKTDSLGNSSCNDSVAVATASNISVFETAGLVPAAVAYSLVDSVFVLTVNNYALPLLDPCAPTGIAEYIGPTVNCYPNPFYNEVLVKGTSKEGRISIIDMNGNLVWQQSAESNSTTINTAHLPNGVYTLRYLEKDQVLNIKVVKY